jgi:hypothetical protein
MTFAVGGSAAPLHWELISKVIITLASAAVPRTRLSNGIFCDIAYPPDNRSNSNMRFNMLQAGKGE